MPYHALEGGAARLQVCLGKIESRDGRGAAGLGLGHVRARHFADVESILGLLECLLEHPHVAALDFDNGGVAQEVHVDGRSLQQHGLLEHPQGLARSRHLTFRSAGSVSGLLSVKDSL